MKKVYRMKNLDCAHCAAKMEAAIAKLEGVESVTISFMTQRLTAELDADKLAVLQEQMKECIHKVDPDCELIGA